MTESTKSKEELGGEDMGKTRGNNTTNILLGFSILFGVVAISLMIYYIVELENTKNSISIASNKPAGEFATEPSATVSSGILNECNYNGLQNQPCVYRAQTLNEAINQCNRLPQICNRFVYNSETKSMSIIGINSNQFIPSQTSSIHTRQVGITYSSSGSDNNANTGGFTGTASFTGGSQTEITSGQTTVTNTFAGAPAVSYY
jgi:hypothetical protein